MCVCVFVSKMCVDKLCVDKWCVSKLCVNKLRVSKLCVSKLCVSKLCVDKLCVSELCVCVSLEWEEAAGGAAGAWEEQARECPTTNKNPTQRGGEKQT